MRYSRIRKKKRQRGYARLFMIGLILFAIIYVVSAGAIGKFLSNKIAPKLKGMGEAQEEDVQSEEDKMQDSMANGPDTAKISDKKESGNVKKISETIRVAPLTIYTIQMAAFSAEENAKEFVREIQERGAGGYIVNDKFFRVIAVGYLDENDTNKVREQLKDDNIECEIYRISCPGANMQVTASAEKIQGIKDAYSLWEAKLRELEDIIKRLDNQDIEGEVAYDRIKSIRSDMEKELNKLKDYRAVEESSSILAGLEEILEQGIQSFDRLLDENYLNKVVFSAKIKYTYIDVAYIYKSYMDSIVKT